MKKRCMKINGEVAEVKEEWSKFKNSLSKAREEVYGTRMKLRKYL